MAVSLFAGLPQGGTAQELSPAFSFVEVEDRPLFTDSTGLSPPAFQRSSTDWRYPVWGAVAGGIWGTVVMLNADEWVAPPAYMVTIPLGAVVGGVAGWVIGAVVVE